MQIKYAAYTALSILLAAASAMAAGKNGVAAVVNGQNVTVAEIKEVYNSNAQIKDKVSFDDFYSKSLDMYINGKLVYQAAEKAKIEESPEYKNKLKLLKEELARNVYLEQQVNKNVSDADVKKLYDEYKSSFKSEKEIKAKHILVKDQAKAKEAIAKLKKGGDFDKLAKEYSKEPAELGWFTKQVMVPEFAEAAYAMKKGQYSQTPVKTQFGYHVIMVEDIRDSKPLPLKDVEPQLKAMLTQQAVGEVFQKLNQNAKIEKYDLKGNPITK